MIKRLYSVLLAVVLLMQPQSSLKALQGPSAEHRNTLLMLAIVSAFGSGGLSAYKSSLLKKAARAEKNNDLRLKRHYEKRAASVDTWVKVLAGGAVGATGLGAWAHYNGVVKGKSGRGNPLSGDRSATPSNSGSRTTTPLIPPVVQSPVTASSSAPDPASILRERERLARLEQEEAARREQEWLEQGRLEQERLEQEQRAQREQERRERLARQERERREREVAMREGRERAAQVLRERFPLLAAKEGELEALKREFDYQELSFRPVTVQKGLTTKINKLEE